VAPAQLHAAALGRALDTRYDDGVTERYRLIAATAATRLGLSPTSTPLDRTSFHVDGRDHRDEPPAEPVVHMTKGYRREHRPDLNHVMWELIVEHQAGMPALMKPLRGHSRAPQAVGHVMQAYIEPLQTTYGATDLVAESALYREDHRNQLAHTAIQWITRVPAPGRDAQVALAQADPLAMAALQEGDRAHELMSTDGGVAPRWLLIDSAPRRLQVQRTVDQPRRKQRDQEGKAFTTVCRPPCACEADARQALSAFEPALQATVLETSPVRAMPRYDKRGRPGQGVQPEQVVYQPDGALASSLPSRHALIAQPCCRILATNALDHTQLTPQELWEGYRGQVQAERGCRLMQEPSFLASSRDLNKPERIMALFMVMTVCL
jgi:transposase